MQECNIRYTFKQLEKYTLFVLKVHLRSILKEVYLKYNSLGHLKSILYFIYFATPQMKWKQKIEMIDSTMVRRPKGNYEAYIN